MNSPTGLFVAFFQRLLQFTMRALVHGCCTSVSVVRGVCSLMPLHAISWRSPLPLLGTWRRSSVVTNLWCRRAKKCKTTRKWKKEHSWPWMGWNFLLTKNQNNVLGYRHHASLVVSVSGLFTVCLWNVNGNIPGATLHVHTLFGILL